MIAPVREPRTPSPTAPSAVPGAAAGRWWLSKPVLAAACGGVLALGTLAWRQRASVPQPPPHELHAQALGWLDEGSDDAVSRARRAARRLSELEYRDPEFGGGVDFVLGMCAFREAQRAETADRDEQYGLAVRHLREAERLALDDTRRPEWVYALATSLHRTGQWEQAKPLLEEAVETWPAGRVDATLQLAEIAIDLNEPSELEESFARCNELLDDETPEGERIDDVYMLATRLLLPLGRREEAVELLARRREDVRVPRSRVDGDATIVLESQVLMAAGDRDGQRQALKRLEPVSRRPGLEQSFASRASYLMGRAEEALGRLEGEAGQAAAAASHFDAAVNHYERTAKRYGLFDEGLAAQLRGAELLRRAGRNEEALSGYRLALEHIQPGTAFRNRWLSLSEFRQAVQSAWSEWLDAGNYPAAIALAERMAPLFDSLKARELQALANQRWAEQLEREAQQSPRFERPSKIAQVRQRWQESGRAWADLAEELKTTSRYTDALWTSADHYRRGHGFWLARTQLSRFVEARPRKQLPVGLVRLGQVLLDLDRPAEAQALFERVAADFPLDVAAIEARYLIGEALLEQQQLDAAEAAWRMMLGAADITPAAREWRQALFSLGRLLYHRAVIARRQAESERLADDADARQARLDEAFGRWDDAVARLEEFLKRYPDAAEAVEARYLLAKALVHRSERPRLRLATADTENARLELRREMHADLEQASIEFLDLRTSLSARQNADGLDALEERMFRDCHFEGAHALYALANHHEAITHYGSAANRYAQDPRVLLAYLQMAHCNERLGRPAETRSLVEQAKVLLEGMPADSFQPQLTSLTKDEWKAWVEWARGALETDSP
ncbi:MAG TPA: tetratricopeptide repeat protein [Planctomycetaceae bacterium]|nr:tetratricopeptide repeat protein [Planctomycetaceae bacterium]